MNNKKKHNKLTAREQNAFPFLAKGLSERLVLSGSIDLTDNSYIEEKNGYWVIKPIDETKKTKG